MKLRNRLLVLLLCLGLLLCLAACSKEKKLEGTEAAGTEPAVTEAPETAPPETEDRTLPTARPEQEPQPAEGVTVMIYMIGSDLESKGGAGTQDLEEIAGSGVNLEACNVAVYAGGSQHWHNDTVRKGKNELLRLTAEGFVPVLELESCSMGEAETLRSFLDSCVERFPAERYVLILWDHGNGPVIGYGKDTAFEGDRLTLSEMRQALEASPFGGDLRLDWVGFDACLMSSAELALIFRDYADYLVASQEVEPSFGWPYDFLADVDSVPAEALLRELAEDYLEACLAYFAQKGYEGRESTLACLDLRCTGELETAVNTLFEAAASDLPAGYDALARSRDRTWTVGKLSTGSDYDLVDLADLCETLHSRYPGETAAVEAVLEKMVLQNATNGDRLCGVSMFYPFYNKPYYEKEWRETYRRMDLFSGYQRFLTGYSQIWLRNDMLENYAQSTEPRRQETGVYTLALTPDQAAHLSSARYYILERVSGEVFLREFVGTDVALKEDRLEARFDGSVIYVRNQTTGEIMIPAVEEIGQTERFVYYTASALGLTTDNYFLALMGQGQESIRFYLVMDRRTGEVKPVSIQPEGFEAKSDGVVQGRKEEVDLSEFTALCWDVGRPSYLTKTESGVILPFGDWKQSTEFKNYGGLNLADGFEFCYGPVPGEDYVLMFELRDTQGSLYCSAPVDVPGERLPAVSSETVEAQVDFSVTDSKVLLERDGVTLRLVLGDDEDLCDRFHLTAENRSGRSVGLRVDSLIYNGEFCGNAWTENLLQPIRPGETADFTLFFGQEMRFYSSIREELPPIEALSFRLSLYAVDESAQMFMDFFGMSQLYETIWDDLELNVRIDGVNSERFDIHDLNTDLFGAQVEPQILAETQAFRAELTGAITAEDEVLIFVLVENRSDRTFQVRCQDAVIDDVVVPVQITWNANTSWGGINMTPPIPPGKKSVLLALLTEDNLLLSYNRKPGRLRLGLSVNYSTVSSDVFQLTEHTDEFYWCDVALTGAPENEPFEVPMDSLKLLYMKNGVTVWLLDQYGEGAYILYAVNYGSRSVSLQISDLGYDDGETDPSVRQMMESDLGSGMRMFLIMDLSDDSGEHRQVKFKLTALNIQKNAILWQSTLLRLPYPYEE